MRSVGGDEQRRGHVASERSVAATGAPCREPRGIGTGNDPGHQQDHASPGQRLGARHEKRKGRRQSGEAGKDGVEIACAGKAERNTECCPGKGKHRAFGKNLSHDGCATHADGPESGDLTQSLVYPDREDRGHEQHRHDEAHRAKDERKLPEIHQSFAKLDDQIGHAVYLEAWILPA